MEKSPFVISAELDLATNTATSSVQPDRLDSFRESLDADLRRMGKNTYWVASGRIARHLDRSARQSSLPVVSLDDRYLGDATHRLGISRGIDSELNDIGYVPRRGYPALAEQFGRIAALGQEIILADDVLYSGDMISWVSENLARVGVTVRGITAGVAIREGVDRLTSQGIDVDAAIIFGNVEDELCERDLAVVPGSGRRIAAQDMSALYFDTDNGKPEQWASISPDVARSFCVASLERSLRLIRPETPMQSIGKFTGYNVTGSFSDAIDKRLGALR